ncbi:hypothetical protein BpHYR1_005476 [Brachionus plicatilis]|uniref:Uncharacterized protein n=1 Tax=Brachionus plicatilis TaxID=10195 RepID=A0A3M7S3E9_BRAPC|nr:hypothetical protein BpHYR1_005476 [Brachionus plicatilis]
MQEIQNMHFSKNRCEFKTIIQKKISRWEGVADLKLFSVYFENTWLKGSFKNWQVYLPHPGFATTNNSIESFNGRISQLSKLLLK